MQNLEHALARTFDRHRIVVWYDVKEELRAEFEAVALPDVEKIEIKNNEFGVKYRILREAPDQKFLLYREGSPPPDLDNWLLDVELAHGVFRADQVALWLSELGLGLEFTDVVAPHADFFKAARRREDLKGLLRRDDTPGQVCLKMLAVCAGGEPRLDSILENLLAEEAAGRAEKMQLIARCALDDFLWGQLERAFGYTSDTPGVHDFVLELFEACYLHGLDEEAATLDTDALVFLKRWKDSVRHHEAFEELSARSADELNIEQDLHKRDYRALVDLDYFELIDQKILSELVQEVAARTLPAGACEQLIRQRRQRHWYARYKHPYEAIDYASRFLQALDTLDLTVRSFEDGIAQYSRHWYLVDQRYRKVIFHAQQSGQVTLLAPLLEEVENRYTNHFLLRLNDQWQQHVDAAPRWEAPPKTLSQRTFYQDRVQPFLTRGNKIVVVISDALRYEAGEELLRLIRQEDRYDASLEPALSVLPSFTQLGMAALLPHKTLALAEDGTVEIDGSSTQGTKNREKILDGAIPGRGTAIQAKDLLAMNKEESRALFRESDVVYVYHNRIDATGDKRDTEERTFEAVEKTLDELMLIVKKLANANASNLLVTADHGFLYQHRALDESDFAGEQGTGEVLAVKNRRFVLGRGLEEAAGFKRFTAAEAGLGGSAEMLLPKSINRLRVKGAGSRYVHGGAALQEVVIPVLQINKKRHSDVSMVEVDILRGTTSLITAGQLTIAFYQVQPVTDKEQPRPLRAGLYTQADELISDSHDLLFDYTSENPREREMQVQFVLTRKADGANGQEVLLRLDHQVGDTSHYKAYKVARYTLRRSFTSDFDF